MTENCQDCGWIKKGQKDSEDDIKALFDSVKCKISQSMFTWVIGGICAMAILAATILYNQGNDIKNMVFSIDKRLSIVETRIEKR